MAWAPGVESDRIGVEGCTIESRFVASIVQRQADEERRDRRRGEKGTEVLLEVC